MSPYLELKLFNILEYIPEQRQDAFVAEFIKDLEPEEQSSILSKWRNIQKNSHIIEIADAVNQYEL